MPIHPDFKKVYHQFLKQYGEEKGKHVYYAWLRKTGYDDTKPMAQQKAKEGFSWTGDLALSPGTTIRGKALHPIKTVHPDEWPSIRQYLEEELVRAARTLKDKPLLLDHSQPLNGKVIEAEYNDGSIEYVAELNDPQVLDMIRKGEIKHCSVEFEWKTLEKVDGVAPRGIHFTGLSLLKSFEAGDPLTTVEVWESILERLKESSKAVSEERDLDGMPSSPFSGQKASETAGKEQAEPQEFILYVVREPAAFLEERFSTAWIDMENGVQAIFGRLREDPENPQPQALLFMKAKGWTLEKMRDWLETHPQYVGKSQPPSTVVGGIQPATSEKMGEAIISSEVEEPVSDLIRKGEILALLPERVPQFWGYGPTELVRRLKQKLQSPSDRE